VRIAAAAAVRAQRCADRRMSIRRFGSSRRVPVAEEQPHARGCARRPELGDRSPYR
jgi:hypothetical protein